MTQLLKFVALALVVAPWANAFPAYGSLAGLSEEELNRIIPTLHVAPPEAPPGPPADTSAKLVFDDAHPYIPPGPHDLRGPCPAFNTLANHGYLPRNGIATPAQIINAVQDGFNMANAAAGFLSYAGIIALGNPLTNLASIGGHTPLTGGIPGSNAPQGGYTAHSIIEGDASLTRGDAFFGDNHSFNQTLWDEFIDFSNRFGAGKYNLTVAGEHRYQRNQDSIATNPQFSFADMRFSTAYFSSVFPILFFIDGRQTDGQLDLDDAVQFFRDGKYPDGFWRSGIPSGHAGADVVLAAHPMSPGKNQGKVNTYTTDPNSATLATPCLLYSNFVTNVVVPMYPKPTGVLKEALIRNLGYMYQFVSPTCTQLFPYGQ